MTDFITARDNVRDRRRAGAWRRFCEATRAPYVRVTPRYSLATVELDMDPAGRRLCAEAIDELQALGRTCQRGRWWCAAGASGAIFTRVPIRDAEAVARSMLAIARCGAEGILAECEAVAAAAWER